MPSDPIAIPSTSTSTRPGSRRRPASRDAAMPAASRAPTASTRGPTSKVPGRLWGDDELWSLHPGLVDGRVGGGDGYALGRERTQQLLGRVDAHVAAEPGGFLVGALEDDRHAVVHRRGDLVGRGGHDRHALAVVEARERERDAAVDGVAERDPRAALGFLLEPLVPAVGQDQDAAALHPAAARVLRAHI